jgi:hypothetical protein
VVGGNMALEESAEHRRTPKAVRTTAGKAVGPLYDSATLPVARV